MFKKFNKREYFEDIAIFRGDKSYSFGELAQLVSLQCAKFKETKTKNIAIVSNDTFEFIVNFLACVYAGKEIFLLNDKNKLKDLKIDYFVANKLHDDCAASTLNDINPDSIIVNFFTSGTTSEPRLIKKTLLNLIGEGEDIIAEFDLTQEDLEFISTAKMKYLFGLTFHFMVPLCGGFVINANNVDFPEQVKGVLEKNLFFVSTPSFLEKISKYDAALPQTPKFIFSSGAKLSDEVFSYFEKSSSVVEIYGSTETGIVGYRRQSTAPNFQKFKNVEISTDDENHLTVRSNFFPENEFKLNDIVNLEGDNFSLIRRSDNILKIQEKRISVAELVEKINRHYFVNNSHCLKVGEKLGCAAVLSDMGKEYFLKNGNLATVGLLKKGLKDTTEIVPQKWRFLDEIPKNDRGKIDKERIEQIFSTKLSYPLVLKRSQSGKNAELTLAFHRESNFFKGHFDDFPIVPGVVQLFWANWFAREIFQTSLATEQIKRMKFSGIIKPDQVIKLALVSETAGISYCYFNGEEKFSSGTFSKEAQYVLV